MAFRNKTAVPAFDEEFNGAPSAWPRGAWDRAACLEKLGFGYDATQRNLISSKLSAKQGDMMESFIGKFKHLNPHPAELPFGDVNPPFPVPYNTSTCHSFSNAENHEWTLARGETHFAVGFVDLGPLRGAKFVGDANTGAPTRFIGYESSPYSVAKTLVIVEMLKQKAADTSRHVLLVWYSST
jgi:hypothetical protein